jgi:hypothetical protein
MPQTIVATIPSQKNLLAMTTSRGHFSKKNGNIIKAK